MSWIKKLMNTFFDDENEDDSFYEKEQDQQQPAKKQRGTEEVNITPKKKPAPFANNARRPTQSNTQHPAKMLHKYPENAPFRFPVIPDEKTVKPSIQRHTYQPKETNVYKESIREEKSYREERPVREQRQQKNEQRRSPVQASGINQEPKRQPFKATHVPSPVYGFERRNKKAAQDIPVTKDKQPEVKSRFTPTDVPSPVYGYGKRKPEGILFIGRDIPSKELAPEELLNTIPAATKESLIDSQEIVQHVNAKVENDVTGENEHHRHAEKETPPLLLENEADKHYTLDSVEIHTEPEAVYEIEEEYDDVSETERLTEVTESVDFKEPYNNLNEPENSHDQNYMEHSIVEETRSAEEVIPSENKAIPEIEEQKVESQPKREAPKSGGQYVPFNVLMLKKDRKSQANKSQAHPLQQNRHIATTERSVPVTDGIRENQLFVPLSFLNKAKVSLEDDDLWLNEQKQTLQSTLDNFNVNAKVVHMTKGPAVTRFEVQPAPGVKVNKITNLTDDIKLSLAARDIRIEAPIPGKNAIGIEVPNQHSRAVFLREIIEHDVFKDSASSLTVALGLDISGAPVVTDLQKMPHGLIAGATGSGKSVCINSILVSLLYKSKPEDVRLLLVDPKMVELAPYNHIPHLVTPVITDAKEATAALKWAVEEMERRYEEFAKTGVREIKRYNQKMEEEQHYKNKMPYIVVVIDELADLMMVSPQEVEEAICRIAQKARACGIHLLLATQRPSVDVITGLIKANVPTRTAFAVSSAIDSRTILDMSGAERLLGRGDMLFMENGSNKAVRIQGTFVSDEEIEEVTRYVKEEYQTDYLFTREELIQHQQTTEVEDELFEEACYYVIEVGAASSSSLQRRFRIGYNRAARLVDMMEGFGLVSEAMGSKPRHVLLTQEELESRLYSGVE
ncbi:hypothetical protein AWM68_10735 [Fictibacillus phosphorivorans]|uniref:FtsK domain-containing protein n=1 Tax=Fictibacillus phosphorivorans TaxID=1221500 RepID=A0A165N4U1_9BACL|nr:DNA translocase FtsK [Fictibacillus phosphorivorans]KZE64608.1 hypothetical protein AWM68_10735 [Fictibacillus phosphorivorans]